MAGISGAEIRALAGHKSQSMTERYTHAAQVMDYERICGVMSGYCGA
jgi:integrase